MKGQKGDFLQINKLNGGFELIKICLVGIGKTGREIARIILEQKNMKLVSLYVAPTAKN